VDDGAWLPCTAESTVDLTTAADGTHSFEVRAIDVVGNVGPTALSAYELDRTAPAPPTFVSSPLSPGNQPIGVWTIGHEAGSTLHCELDGVAIPSCDPTVTATLVDDGLHLLVVWAVDAAGNVGATATSEYLLDRVAPALPIVVAPITPGHERTPTWWITVDADAVAECSFDGGPMAACASVFSASAVQDGLHTLVVKARDAAGNVTSTVTSTYLLDTVPPAAPAITQTPGPGGWAWRFTLEAGASAQCSVDGSAWAPCTSPVPGGSPGKPVRFEVRAVDRAGNRSAVTSLSVTPPSPAPPAVAAPPAVPPAPPPPPPLGPQRAAPAAAPLVPTPRAPPTAVAPRPPLDVEAAAPELVEVTSGPRPLRGFDRLTNPVAGLVQAAAEHTTLPVLVVLAVVMFLAVQNRIDRRDPKLANAPVRHEPEYMEFK
jgi:hypothetical protein